MKPLNLAIGALLAVGAAGVNALVPSVQAQYSCNAAYYAAADGSCVPNVAYDINCDDIGWRVYQLRNNAVDPYGLDVYNGLGNGWTCDGVGYYG